MPKAIIFDFDGVLIDSEKYWPEITNILFTKLLKRACDPSDHQKITGHGMQGTHEIFTKDYGLTLSLAQYAEAVVAEATCIYDTLAQPISGVEACLQRLQSMNTRMAIASANQRHMIDIALDRLRLRKHFLAICSADDVPGRTKPFPDVYLHAATRMGILPTVCIAIEDSAPGIASAKAAGMTCIAFHTEHNNAQDLSGADIHIHSFDELTTDRLDSLLA